MLDNLSVRNKFLVASCVPTVCLVVLAVMAFSAGEPVLGAVAAAGALSTVAVAVHLGQRTGRRVAAVAGSLDGFDPSADPAADPSADSSEADTGDATGGGADDEIGALTRAAGELVLRAGRAREAHLDATAARSTELLMATASGSLSLVDSQLDEIDWLEAEEDDAERLGRLFTLDHHTARLHRGLARLLVLAGNDSLDGRSQPAPVADVIRVAMGENADYRSIELRTLDEVMIVPTAACELALLLSELLANSTANTEDGAPTEVYAAHLDDGSYRVTIIDRGSGMDAACLHAARSAVRNPRGIADLPDARIGLHVVGRLARHLGAAIDFSDTAGSGLTVDVRLPAGLMAPIPEVPLAAPSLVTQADVAEEALEGRAWNPPTIPPRAAEVTEITAAAAPASQTAKPRPVATPSPEAELEPAAKAESEPDPNPEPAATRAPAAVEPAGAPTPTERPPSPTSTEVWTPPAIPARASGVGSAATGRQPTEPEPSVLDPEQPPGVPGDGAPAVLTRRKRGATKAHTSSGPPVRVSTRSPNETRSMITTYRKGLKDGRDNPPTED